MPFRRGGFALTPPSVLIFVISLVLAVLAMLVHYVHLSVPIIGASRSAPVADCPPLSRPHNLHYVGMPAAQGNLARLSLRGLFDRDDR